MPRPLTSELSCCCTAGPSVKQPENFTMVWLEKCGHCFRIYFRFSGQKFTRSLLTDDTRSASGALARPEGNLRRIKLGTLELPDSVGTVTFLLSTSSTTCPRRS